MKWNIVWALSSFDIGGNTPRASQVNRMMLLGWFSDKQGILALLIYSIGYALQSSLVSLSQTRRFRNVNLPSCVLSEGSVVVVDFSGFLVEHDVLEDGTKADSAENIGLFLG